MSIYTRTNLVLLLKDIIYEFLSFGMIYRLVYNFLKLRLLMR